MSKKLIVSENHIMKLILDEFNNNSLDIKFMLSDWYSVENDENNGNILIQRRDFQNDRFDIVSQFDETTYAIKETHITPMGINALNATFLAHPEIQEIMYSPEVQFLISADKEVNVKANTIAIEEVRSRLMQYQKEFTISQFDLENENRRINQNLKAIITSGEISYGSIEVFNGRNFMLISVPLEIFVTNKGEFSNQQKFLFGSSEILEGGKPKMFNIPLITWDYGMGLDTNPTQLLPKLATNNKRASEVKTYKVSKAFGISFTVQIDFNNEFLKHIYLESIQEKLSIPTYYIEMWTNYYDTNDKVMKELAGSRVKRAFNLEVNKPIQELSLGDKIEHVLNFSPSEKGWYE